MDGVVPIQDLSCYVGEDVTHSFTLGTRILTSSVGNPTIITTDGPHGFRTGQQVFISRHVGSTPNIDGAYAVIVISATAFALPMNVSVAGAEGFVTSLTASIALWTIVMTIKDSDVNPSFTKTVNGVVTDGGNREFQVFVPSATNATIPVSNSHKYDIWKTNLNSAFVLSEGKYIVMTERRITPV